MQLFGKIECKPKGVMCNVQILAEPDKHITNLKTFKINKTMLNNFQ